MACLSCVAYCRKVTCKLCGAEPTVMARVGQPILPLCGSVWGEGSERGLCHYLASGGLPGCHTFSSHFTHSPYVTSALLAIALVLNPRVGGFVYVLRPCGPFKQSFLKIQQFLPLPQLPLVFIGRSYGDLSSWCWNPGLCGLAWGWDCSLPRYPS